MEKYSIDGFYLYSGSQGNLTGEIEIDSDGFFESIIIDYMSNFPTQLIKGNIQDTNTSTKLSFFKFPAVNNLANLVYQLEKPKSNTFAGEYKGSWRALPYKLEINEESSLMVAQIDISVIGIGDYAQLNLLKK
jgi:hypothetical protein